MNLDMLEIGQKLELEVFLGESSFPVKTRVMGKSQGAILVEPYAYNGKVVDFDSSKNKNITFDLHCIDENMAGRRVWKNVIVNCISYRDKEYYAIRTRIFGSMSRSSERRGGNRIVLDFDGEAIYHKEKFDMHLVDICENGVAFMMDKNVGYVNSSFKVKFSDMVRNDVFNMTIEIRLVRIEERDDKYFYAGAITNKPDDLLAYIYYRRLEQKMAELK